MTTTATTIRIQDPYSQNKVWLVKKYPCGHYYWTQEISGRQIYPFKRIGLKKIEMFVPGWKEA